MKTQTYQERIESIAERKALSRAFTRKTPSLTFSGLTTREQESLVLLLIESNEAVREYIATQITSDLEDAYCDQLRPSEAEDDAIDLRRFAEEDAAQRSRDMQLEMRGS